MILMCMIYQILCGNARRENIYVRILCRMMWFVMWTSPKYVEQIQAFRISIRDQTRNAVTCYTLSSKSACLCVYEGKSISNSTFL